VKARSFAADSEFMDRGMNAAIDPGEVGRQQHHRPNTIRFDENYAGKMSMPQASG
jgi:hypothetical protein